MTDRILRDELWESDRFLDLPTDIARLAFLRFLSAADDFGNFEGGTRRLARMIQASTQAKTEDAVTGAIDALMAADLIRRYTVDGRELFHIPRTKPHRQYIVRKMPASPWDMDLKLGKTQRVETRGLAKYQQNQALGENVATTSQTDSNHVAKGVGVGVGVGIESKGRAESIRGGASARLLGDNSPEPTPAGAACLAMRKAGMALTNPGDPRLIALCAQGATLAEFAGLAAEAVEKRKGFAWAIVTLQARRAEAAAIALAPKPAEKAASAEAERSAAYLREQAEHAKAAKEEAAARKAARTTTTKETE